MKMTLKQLKSLIKEEIMNANAGVRRFSFDESGYNAVVRLTPDGTTQVVKKDPPAVAVGGFERDADDEYASFEDGLERFEQELADAAMTGDFSAVEQFEVR